jgi:hypothetical protein
MPRVPEGIEDGILRGIYLYQRRGAQAKHRAQIFAQRRDDDRGAAGAGDPGREVRRRAPICGA